MTSIVRGVSAPVPVSGVDVPVDSCAGVGPMFGRWTRSIVGGMMHVLLIVGTGDLSMNGPGFVADVEAFGGGFFDRVLLPAFVICATMRV